MFAVANIHFIPARRRRGFPLKMPLYGSAVWNPVSAESAAFCSVFRNPVETESKERDIPHERHSKKRNKKREIPQASGILESGTSRTAGHAGMTVVYDP